MEIPRGIFQLSTKVLIKFAQRQFKAAVEDRFEVFLGFCRTLKCQCGLGRMIFGPTPHQLSQAMAPLIFCLPPEIMDLIFSFLYLAPGLKSRDRLGWLNIAHVCHQWRDIALNQPRFWSYIDITTLTLAGANEMLVRSKNAPLHLVANFYRYHRDSKRLDAVRKQLEAHISHIQSLNIYSHPLPLSRTLVRLTTSPAPALESLSLCARRELRMQREALAPIEIPPTLFDSTAPRLTRLEFDNCYISWSAPLFKGLRHLKLLYRDDAERPDLQSWRDAMCEFSRLESLVLHAATPVAPQIITPIRVKLITLPSLTRLHLSDSANCCALALSHLVLPSLAWLHIEVSSSHPHGDDIQTVLPHFVLSAHGHQDTMPLQSMVVDVCSHRIDILLWTVPDAGMDYHDYGSFAGASPSARAVFTAHSSFWDTGASTGVCRAILSALPVSSLVTLTVLDCRVVPEEIWLGNTPTSQWPSLKCLRLRSSTLCFFTSTLTENVPPEGPLLPSLTKLIITGSPLDVCTAKGLRHMLLTRMEQGVPIQTLDLSECGVVRGAVQLFHDIITVLWDPVGIWLLQEVLRPAPQNQSEG